MSRALLKAAESGDLVKVQQQLSDGADVNCVHKATGRTPLIQAVISGHLEVAQMLIEAGADVNHFDTAVEFSPLLWACGEGHADIVELLLSAMADVNGRSPEFGWTPLLAAAQIGSIPIIQRLLKAGADLHASTTDGRTAVAISRTAKKLEVAEMLEALGCRVDCTVSAPQRLPWPSVNSEATNVDFAIPASVVRGLIIAMNHFESTAPHAESKDVLLAMMDDVFSRFCTIKKRPYGRSGSYQSPPEYCQKNEYLIQSEIVSPRRAELATRNDESGTEYLYVLQKKGNEWRVDSKKYRLTGGKWDSWMI